MELFVIQDAKIIKMELGQYVGTNVLQELRNVEICYVLKVHQNVPQMF